MDATLRRRRLVAEDTWELDFDLGGDTIEFTAGQYCRVGLPRLDAPDKKGSRKFSIVNPPHDNGHLVVATRAGVTGYKCTLCALLPGERVSIEKIKGRFVLPAEVTRPLVFVAGGIGIAPFMSMLGDLEHRGRLEDVVLLYFNRNPQSAAYLGELEELAHAHPGFRLVVSMTRHEPWQGVQERLSERLLTGLLGDVTRYDVYVVGTPAMVAAARVTLRDAGVSKEHLFDEDFEGYDELAA